MKKFYLILFIILFILGVTSGLFIYRYFAKEEDTWLEREGNNNYEEIIYHDVPVSHTASEAILYLKERDIMTGKEDGNFYPEEEVSAKEVLQTLLMASLPRLNQESLTEEELVDLLKEKKVLPATFSTEMLNSSLTNYDVAIILARADIQICGEMQLIGDATIMHRESFDDEEQTLLQHAWKRGFIGSNYHVVHRAELAEMIYCFLTC